jgi:branched-chain amino acid transport system permease protein
MRNPAIRRLAGPAAWIVFFMILALVPTFGLSRYYLTVIDQAMILSIAVLGLYFVLGLTGLLSLTQAGFLGLGAYAAAIMSTRLGLPIWINVPAGTIVATAFGVLLGIPSLKLRGHYLAMTTIGFGIILDLVYSNWRPVTGGSDGIPGIKATEALGLSLAHPGLFFYLIFLCLAVGTVVALRISSSRMGRALKAIRENELAAEANGIDSTRYKIAAFALSAAYAGLAGALWAHFYRFIAPETFGFQQSVQLLAMLVIGGSTMVPGSLIGAFLLTFLPEWLRFLQGSYIAVYGAAIMLAMVFLPDGITGGVLRVVRLMFRRGEETPSVLGQSGEVPDGTAAN